MFYFVVLNGMLCVYTICIPMVTVGFPTQRDSNAGLNALFDFSLSKLLVNS